MTNPQTEWLIAVDVGNSTFKLGVYSAESGDDSPTPERIVRLRGDELTQLSSILPVGCADWFVASVNGVAEGKLTGWVRATRRSDACRSLATEDLPIIVKTESPQRVGIDRLLAAFGANARREAGRPAIVIDAGSAITVDALDVDGAFLGGAILPGLSLQAKALDDFTERLPLVEIGDDAAPPPVGRNTEAAIRSGIVWGVRGAVKELARRMSLEFNSTPQLFLTGGDASVLLTAFDEQPIVVPHLVLAGIVLTARHLRLRGE